MLWTDLAKLGCSRRQFLHRRTGEQWAERRFLPTVQKSCMFRLIGGGPAREPQNSCLLATSINIIVKGDGIQRKDLLYNLPFFPLLHYNSFSFDNSPIQRDLMISHIEGNPTQVVPLEQHPNSSLMAKHRGRKKASKGKHANHHSQFPRFLLFFQTRSHSFQSNDQNKILRVLNLNRVEWNAYVKVGTLISKLQLYYLCCAHIYVILAIVSQPNSHSPVLSAFFTPLLLQWAEKWGKWAGSATGCTTPVCFSFSKNLSRVFFLSLSLSMAFDTRSWS